MAAAVPGQGVTFSKNTMRASGRICGRRLSFQAAGSIEAAQNSIPISCSYAGAATWTREIDPSSIVWATPAATLASGAVAPDSVATIAGSGFASTAEAKPPLPETLGGVSVRIVDSAGESRQAGLYSTGFYRVDFLVPAAVAHGAASIELIRSGAVAARAPVVVEPVAPGVFTAAQSGSGNADGAAEKTMPGGARESHSLFRYDAGLRQTLVTPVSFGNAESVQLVLSGTGFRAASSAEAWIDGEAVPVASFGPHPESPGRDLVTIGPLPRSLANRGEVPLSLGFDGRAANAVTVTFIE
jgi:uncharacterized protein (TIGR03437 family)